MILLLILLSLIISGCCTNSEIILPQAPERQAIESPKSVQDLAEILAYYEQLIQEWEQWATAVKQIIE